MARDQKAVHHTVSALWNDYLDADWLAATAEPVLNPLQKIVDPHHHVFWNSPFPYRPESLFEDLDSGHNVVGTVYAESGQMYRSRGPEHLKPVGEAEYATGVAAMAASNEILACQACAGLIGSCDLTLAPELVRETLEKQIAVSDGRLKGIRIYVNFDPHGFVDWGNEPAQGLLSDVDFLRGFDVLTELDLVVDIMGLFHQLPEIAEFARTHPDSKIVVNHLGGPCGVGPYREESEGAREGWLSGIRAIAAQPNIFLKLGGVANPFYSRLDFRSDPQAPTSEALQAAFTPFFEPAIAELGPSRCMFESNWPVDKRDCSYRVLWNAFKRVASAYSETEQAQMLADTAIGVYQLDLDG